MRVLGSATSLALALASPARGEAPLPAPLTTASVTSDAVTTSTE